MFELTSYQKNMYDTHCFFSDSGVCNVGGCLFFKRQIDLTKLELAINKLIMFSDGLRINIKTESLKVYQFAADYQYESIEVLNLKENEYKAVLEARMAEPFDINNKLYDFAIVNVEGETGVFVKLHHLVSDAWSLSVIAAKINEYYNAICEGNEICNDSSSYFDFVEKENAYKTSKKFLRDEQFWQEKLEAKPAPVSMSNKKSDNLSAKAKRSTFAITGETYRLINDYCAENAVSIAVLFEAVTAVYASRINSLDSATLCSVIVNRDGYDEKNTVGMFNSILPITFNTNSSQSFKALCEQISLEHFKLFRHQKYPLENIMKIMREKHGKDIVPYDIMVSYQNAELNIDGYDSLEWIFNSASDLGFMLNISETLSKNEISINIDWRENLYTANEVEAIYNRLIFMLVQSLNNPEILLADIDIVTESERKTLLVDFNNTAKVYPKDRCLHWYLEDNTKHFPDKTALIFDGKEMTYDEFNKKTNSLARYICEKAGDKKQIIGIMCERSFEMMISVYAVLKSGNAYMPIDPEFPTQRKEYMVKDSEAPLVLTLSKFSGEITCAKTVNVDTFDFASYGNDNLNVNSSSTDTAYVIYTSGSTGEPKGAMIAHHSAVNRIKWMHEKYPLCADDVILQKTPYTFDVSVWELFWWSMYGGTLSIMNPAEHKDPSEILGAIKNGKITHMHFVPSMLNAFLTYMSANPKAIDGLSTLKYVFSSGEALQVNHVKSFYNIFSPFGTTLHNLYGPTECAVDVSYYDCFADDKSENIPIGKPIDNTQLLVLDKNRKLLPIGVVGELYISGVQVGKGYLNRPELTAEKFVENEYFDSPAMYKTGDLAMWLPDGNIEYCGRTDFQIKIRGLRVELGDIEAAVQKYPEIGQVAVLAVDINDEKALCAYFTAKATIDYASVKEFLKQYLPDYMIPQYHFQMDEFPITANGKLDRKALPLPQINNTCEEYVAPSTPLESVIQKYASELLKTENISCSANLFDYGLSSLGVISIITDLSIEGFELKVKSFYEHKTIKDIAKAYYDGEADDDYSEDKHYYSDISDIADYSLPLKQGNAVLLTGASGFLGVHIIDELMNTTDKKIYCLVRSESKLESAIKEYTSVDYPNERIIAVKGDITLPDLGIDSAVLPVIRQEITDIIHSAADVTFFCDWERSKLINYTGTCNVLALAEESGAKLHHVSTMSVSGDLLTRQTVHNPEFTESQLYIGQIYKDNVYAHSKYIAEKELVKAIRNGKVNASIYRVANLTWRASDGKFQSNYLNNDLYIMTSVMKNLRKIPAELAEENLALTPVDDCARAIVSLMRNEKNAVYHLYSDNSPNLLEYMSAIVDFSAVSLSDFCDILRQQTDSFSMFAIAYINGIVDGGNESVVLLKKTTTVDALKELAFKWQELGDKYYKNFNSFGGCKK